MNHRGDAVGLRSRGLAADAGSARAEAEPLRTFRVEGTSMWPTLDDGARITVAPPARCHVLGHRWPPVEGALVVARHPYRRGRLIVKRVVECRGERLILRGDAGPESEDSGAFGALALHDLVGLVVGIESAKREGQ